MSRKRWIYVGALGVVTIAFAVDRLFLDSPQQAEAKPTPPRRPAPRPAPGVKPAQDRPVIMDPSLAWLDKLSDPSPGRDVFAPCPEWLAKREQQAKAEAAAAAEKGPRPGSPEAFQAAHKLQATTVLRGGGMAVVDGQCLKIGEVVDGFRLARVQAAGVEFRRGDRRAVLELPMPPGPGPKEPAALGTPEPGSSPPEGTSSGPTSRPASKWELLRRWWSGRPQTRITGE